MTTKERNEHLVRKWNFMLGPLDDKKTSKTRFARIFENTALHSDTNTMKLVLPLLQRLLYTMSNIKVSSSVKNSLSLGSFERDSVIDNQSIMPDGAAAFIDSIVQNALRLNLEKLNHIRLTEKTDKLEISIIY